MNFIKIVSLVLAVMFFAGSSTYAVPGEGEPEEVEQSSVSKMVEAIQKEIDANRKLLGASEGKDIIAVFGNTGSGKSTTLNWLAGISLKVDKLKRIELENPEDPNALTIGGGDMSVTRFPESINISSTEFFDLPGFRDTEYGEIELINVAFIKQILEKANSVKIIFVAGQELVIADRGTHLKEFLDSLGKMFTGDYFNDVLHYSSIFIVTKSDYPTDELNDYLQEYVVEEECPILYDWMKNGKLFAVCKPQGKVIVEEGKAEILKALGECRGKKLCDLNWVSVYRPETVNTLKGIFNEVLTQTFDKILPNPEKLDSISSYREAIDNVKGSGKEGFESFWDRFDKAIGEYSVIKLLRPLAVDLFAGINEKFKIEAQRRLRNFISILETKLEELQIEFKTSLEKSLEAVASLQVKDLNEKVKFDCTDLAKVEDKKKDLKELSDFVIADKIMTAIKSDEGIKALVQKHEGSNSELYNEFLQNFERNGIKKFVAEVRKSIIASENECDSFIETMRIKVEEEREKKRREDAEQAQKKLQEQQERLLEEQRKRDEEQYKRRREEIEEQQRQIKEAEAKQREQQKELDETIAEMQQREAERILAEAIARALNRSSGRVPTERMDRLMEQNERLARNQKTTDPCVIC